MDYGYDSKLLNRYVKLKLFEQNCNEYNQKKEHERNEVNYIEMRTVNLDDRIYDTSEE